MRPEHKRAIARSVMFTMIRNWKDVKPCPQCGKRVYGNYAGNICKRCKSNQLNLQKLANIGYGSSEALKRH